jgi:hypothetical protein
VTGAFNPRAVLAMLAFGAIAFLAMLWFIGQGDIGPGPDNGQAHANGHGLAGYAALASLLDKQGYDVSLSRNQGRLDDAETLLVLTPAAISDAADLREIIEQRRYQGPILIILPKWFAAKLPANTKGAKEGWVQLFGADIPGFAKDLPDELEMTLEIDKLKGAAADWEGLGLNGKLPDRSSVLALDGGPWVSLARDANGRDLVAFADDGGCYPALETAAGVEPLRADECERKWAVTTVFEPDLVNNYGLADRSRALLAARIVDLAGEEKRFPVVFDMTLAGFGGQRNLLTLAFAPPFLAATLCLVLALIAVGWRAFGRFGPQLAEAREIALGKTQLAANAAGFVRRSGRLHLLGGPYAALVGRRLAAALGIRGADPQTIDAALARRGKRSFTALTAQLESARGANEILRAAQALHTLERTIIR